MTKEQILEKLNTIHNGAYTNIKFRSIITSNKLHKDKVVWKEVEAIVCLGVNSAHMKAVQNQKAERAAEGKVPTGRRHWGEWVPGSKYLRTHNDNLYLRAVASQSPYHPVKVKYILNDQEISEALAREYTQPSQWTKEKQFIFDFKLENVLQLGKEVK